MNTRSAITMTMLLAVALAVPCVAAPVAKNTGTDVNVTGSGAKYKTEVTRTTSGTLVNSDLRQVSLLTSQVLRHMNTAMQNLTDKDSDSAKGALESANSLIGIVRDILPATKVITVVKDAKGKQVYRHTEIAQDDVVALYAGVQTVNVLEEILDAKMSNNEGDEYLGTVDIYTSVLADIGYIERKISAALQLIDEPFEARGQLALAQVNGVDMRREEVESPLLEAHKALQLAEEQIDAKEYEPAKDNLTMAKIKLEEYRVLFGSAKQKAIKAITDEIEVVKKDIKKEGVSGRIRECWHNTVKLFEYKNPKTAKATQVNSAEKK